MAGIVGNSGNPWVAADRSGSFSLTLAPGRYRLKAKDEVDGYPDPSFWVGVDPRAKFPVIAVGTTDIVGVKVVLGAPRRCPKWPGPRCPESHPVAGAKIRIEDARNSDAYVEVSPAGLGTSDIRLPASRL